MSVQRIQSPSRTLRGSSPNHRIHPGECGGFSLPTPTSDSPRKSIRSWGQALEVSGELSGRFLRWAGCKEHFADCVRLHVESFIGRPGDLSELKN
ncbi:hypothetical protein [Corynebacterium efficiens YS-314]|uniref:Uncharacterized protein n=1 Tax=Corynebacterium efficiens (strain DSM 44549 / YS-314 / AJ 12310 / JCM 11189 / NBRC 100395) TaxID=196164 RepID=Q8FN32_COREF|nr:hypothetical protein [Corynebacterium efficiens YS-314]